MKASGVFVLISFTIITAGLALAASPVTGDSASSSGKQGDPDPTPTGIAVDSDWKRALYDFAKKNSVHPSWGIAHSVRNYQTTKSLAQTEGITLDEDVLFAAAFLHDIGGLSSFAKKDVDHAVRSTEVIEPLLPGWGFPMQKWPKVKEMILGHTYYGPAPNSPPALAFRDADVLDFLGSVGVARMLAVTEEAGFSDGTLKPTVDTLKSFARTMAEKCSLKACQSLAKPREEELNRFLRELDSETFSGNAL
jgi:uncharacterized protein